MNFQCAGIVVVNGWYWSVIPDPQSMKLTYDTETGKQQWLPSYCRLTEKYETHLQATMAVASWMRRN